MVRTLAAVAVVAACGNPGSMPSDALGDSSPLSGDAAPRQIHGRALVRQILSDASHQPVLGPDVAYHEISVTLKGTTDTAIPVGVDGGFGFSTTDARYRLAISFDGGIETERSEERR